MLGLKKVGFFALSVAFVAGMGCGTVVASEKKLPVLPWPDVDEAKPKAGMLNFETQTDPFEIKIDGDVKNFTTTSQGQSDDAWQETTKIAGTIGAILGVTIAASSLIKTYAWPIIKKQLTPPNYLKHAKAISEAFASAATAHEAASLQQQFNTTINKIKQLNDPQDISSFKEIMKNMDGNKYTKQENQDMLYNKYLELLETPEEKIQRLRELQVAKKIAEQKKKEEQKALQLANTQKQQTSSKQNTMQPNNLVSIQGK